MNKRGLFIVCTGLEGAGKTTLATSTAQYFMQQGYKVWLTKEPGGTALGVPLREYVVNTADLSLREQVFFFTTDRIVHRREIQQALELGTLVICDRYVESTVAHQGHLHAGGLTPSLMDTFVEIGTGGLKPDLYIWLDVDPETGLQRKRTQGELNVFDLKTVEYHKIVHQGLSRFLQDGDVPYLKLDATLPLEVLNLQIQEVIQKLLNNGSKVARK